MKKIKDAKRDAKPSNAKLVEAADLIVCFWLVHHEHHPATYESGVTALLRKLLSENHA